VADPVIQLPYRIIDVDEDLPIRLQKNFDEIARLLGMLQIYENKTGKPVNSKVVNSGMDADGVLPTIKLSEKYVGLQNTLQLADEAVTEAKIAVNAITANKITTDAVTEAKIAAAAVTALKIANGSIEVAKFASGLRPVQVVSSLPALPDANYPQGATVFLTTDNVLYRSTGTAWTAAVSTSDLTDKLVGLTHELQLADQAVTEAKLALGTVQTDHLADLSVTDMKLAAGTVTEAKTNWKTHLLY